MATGSGPTESVIVNDFWRKQIVFHARSDPGTDCDPYDRKNQRGHHCGHALPRRVAEQIARPCRLCYPTSTKKD
jgi:hypothetical protein